MADWNDENITGQGASNSKMTLSAACRPPTLQERLDGAVKEAEQRLAEAKEARDICKRNPDLERLLDIMQKGRF